MIRIERAGHDQGRVLSRRSFVHVMPISSLSLIHTRLIVGASSFNRPRLIAYRVHQTLDRPLVSSVS